MNRWDAWDELRFQDSVRDAIRRMPGKTSLIENPKHPGNSDVLFSAREVTGVVELKCCKEFNWDNKLRLRHPLTAEQRLFLRAHGSHGSGSAFVGVLFSCGDYRCNKAAFWSWDQIDLMFSGPLREVVSKARWSGPWPPNEIELERLAQVLTNGQQR